MKRVLITQSNYIPWKGYFDSIHLVDEVILYDEMQFTKRDWRNRNIIKTPQGPAWLTIPVQVKGKFFQKISETKISERNWNEKHWKTLCANYSRAAHFKPLKDFIGHLYAHAKMEYLSEINYWFLTELGKWMNLNTPIQLRVIPPLEENPTDRLVTLCKLRGATHYYTGPAAKAYLEVDKFSKQNIEVCYIDFGGYIEYPQVFPPFAHSVSVIDLLFNTGADFKKYMKNF